MPVKYDAPMLDTFGMESFNEIRLQVRSLYSPLKALGGILRFVFLTGISKFSQLSIFSELNNLKVITMNDEYAAICGITKEELMTQMQPEIQALADTTKHARLLSNNTTVTILARTRRMYSTRSA